MLAIPAGASCVICIRRPEEINEYVAGAAAEGYESPAAFVELEEGTYNAESEGFYCTECYIAIGQPLGVAP